MSNGTAYAPIGDYGLIGDTQSAALVSRDGSIDWCCWPRFDSPAVFCRLLDAHQGGWFRVAPTGEFISSREYVGSTNVLATTFETARGSVRLVDFMPAGHLVTQGAEGPDGQRILRLIEGLAGEVELEVSFRPTFDYARAKTLLEPTAGGAAANGGSESLKLICPIVLQSGAGGGLLGQTTVGATDRVWLELGYGSGQSTARPDHEAELNGRSNSGVPGRTGAATTAHTVSSCCGAHWYSSY